MKTWRRKLLHRHNSGTLVLSGTIMSLAGLENAKEVEIKVDNGILTVRPIAPGAITSIIGIDCFTWEDVEYVGRMMKEKGYVPGVNGPKAGTADGQEGEA